MIEIPLTEIRRKATLWQAEDNRWHFHLLVPGCAFNKQSDQYALVLENTSLRETYVFYSDEPQVETDHSLLLLLHGDQILDEGKAVLDAGSPQIQPVLERAKELSVHGVRWHHHMLFPGCIYSGQPDQWVIAFEDPETNQVIEVPYDTEPESDLRKIELLFFAQHAV